MIIETMNSVYQITYSSDKKLLVTMIDSKIQGPTFLQIGETIEVKCIQLIAGGGMWLDDIRTSNIISIRAHK